MGSQNQTSSFPLRAGLIPPVNFSSRVRYRLFNCWLSLFLEFLNFFLNFAGFSNLAQGISPHAFFDVLSVNAGEKFPDFAGLKFPLSGKKIY